MNSSIAKGILYSADVVIILIIFVMGLVIALTYDDDTIDLNEIKKSGDANKETLLNMGEECNDTSNTMSNIRTACALLGAFAVAIFASLYAVRWIIGEDRNKYIFHIACEAFIILIVLIIFIIMYGVYPKHSKTYISNAENWKELTLNMSWKWNSKNRNISENFEKKHQNRQEYILSDNIYVFDGDHIERNCNNYICIETSQIKNDDDFHIIVNIFTIICYN